MTDIRRGPARWERAALNAVRKPHGKAAALYFDRVAVARDISTTASIIADVRTPWEHVRDAWRWDFEARETIPLGLKRSYVTCSLYCTVMQIALDRATLDKGEIAKAFDITDGGKYGHAVRVRPLSTKANRRCEVCGTQVISR